MLAAALVGRRWPDHPLAHGPSDDVAACEIIEKGVRLVVAHRLEYRPAVFFVGFVAVRSGGSAISIQSHPEQFFGRRDVERSHFHQSRTERDFEGHRAPLVERARYQLSDRIPHVLIHAPQKETFIVGQSAPLPPLSSERLIESMMR